MPNSLSRPSPLSSRTQKRVLDIGCNDGTLLEQIPDDFERWGIDPSDIAATIPPPVQVINTVFPSDSATHRLSGLSFDLITSVAMFYDLEDPVGFARNVQALLDCDGIWVLEMSYMPLMLAMNSFDTVCHEHLEYYSLSVLNTIMSRAGLRIFKVSLNWINGGSIRCYVCKADCFRYDTAQARDMIRRLQVNEFQMQLDTNVPYLAFQLRIDALRTQMTELLARIHADGGRVHVYGASTKGNVLLQWYGIDSYKVPFAADRNPDKVGALTLGTGIRIISEEQSREMRPGLLSRAALALQEGVPKAGTRDHFGRHQDDLPAPSNHGCDGGESGCGDRERGGHGRHA